MINKFVLYTLGFLSSILLLQAQEQRLHLRSGNKAYAEKKYQEAQTHFEKASIQQGDLSSTAYFALGNSLYRQKRFEQASKAYEQALKVDSLSQAESAEVMHNLGNIAMQAKQYEQAIESYKQALIMNPNDDDTRYNLVLAQKQLQKQPPSQNNQDQQQENKEQQNDPQQPSQSQDNPETKGDQQADEPKDSPMSREQVEQLLNNYKRSDEATRKRVEQQERQASELSQRQRKRRW